MSSDDELIEAMLVAMYDDGCPGAVDSMRAVLAVVRAHDQDGERWRTLLRLATRWPQTELVATDDDGWPAEKRSREVWCEEIKALLIEHGLDGTGNEAKQRRVELLKQVFSTGSWTRIENMRAEEIKAGYEAMKVALCPPITADLTKK